MFKLFITNIIKRIVESLLLFLSIESVLKRSETLAFNKNLINKFFISLTNIIYYFFKNNSIGII